MESVVPDSQNGPFSSYGVSGPKRPIFKAKRAPEQISIFFGDPEFRRHFCQKISWTSVKTLVVEPVGLDGQNDPFSRSNEPQSRIIVTQGI
ncbi:hypothetical protein H5410_058878 [Solanum commersonii]|uniref:Uncharacterized protein n=1 Tax=Solanum commersonii TaxID=4109 RepID=A0A9J5W185_SOLCO|nr:hypothetical protein H5410_058878 [Solanum commersonii]